MFLLCIASFAMAQESAFKLGVRLSGGYSVNPGVDKILVSEDYYSNYEFKDRGCIVPGASVFFEYHPSKSLFGVECGADYHQKASELKYSDKKELNYKVKPRYNYLGLCAMFKVFPWRQGFSVCAGGRIGANLNSDGIKYESNQEEERFSDYHYGTASETEHLLQEKLTGRPDISVGGGFGYEFKKRITLDLRYFYGLNSTIRTETNDYRWVEYSNHSHNIELSVGYLFNL